VINVASFQRDRRLTFWQFGFRVLACLLLATSAFSQTPPHRPARLDSTDANTIAARRVAIQKGGRFMGWKFAAQSHQDTRKWQRPLPPQASSMPASAEYSVAGISRLGASGTSGFGNVGFALRPGLPAGFIPTAVTSGDFNEDGKMDFAVSNGGDNTIYVFLGNGDGTFQVPEVLYTQGQAPDWITAVRLRKNGHLDLAVTDGDSNTVEVFPGNGDGTFQASTQTALPQIPTFILPADVNNDGNQDLVVGLGRLEQHFVSVYNQRYDADGERWSYMPDNSVNFDDRKNFFTNQPKNGVIGVSIHETLLVEFGNPSVILLDPHSDCLYRKVASE
jgi:FG-GAP-like repeat/FG-GAP repeat